jgi:hypothetical protein
MVVLGAPGHSTSRSIGMPPRSRAQQRTGGVSGKGKGLPPTPLIHEDLLLKCEKAQQPSQTT